jgi:signal transduction histidine kinase/ActR/RegA family two-component response regulator
VRVARSRANDKMIGTRGHRSLEQIIAGTLPQGTGVTTTLEGDEVFTAFTRLHDSNWTIVMGLPVAIAQAPARTSLAITSLVVLLSLAIGLVSAFFVARHINEPMAQLRGAAAALGRGEPPQLAPSGVREIDDVAAALAGASRELKAAEEERAELLRREHEARTQAEAANSAKDQFLAMLGHELRNPLAALASAAALLEMNRSDAAAQARIHGVITRQVANLKRLTDDLLDAARALLGKIELQHAPVDLARVAAGVLGAMAATGRAQGHRIEEDLREAWTLGDEVRLEQVVANLLVNATKYTPPGKAIRISTRTEGADAVLEIEDEGQGMSPELAARAFDLFVQGKRHLDRSQGGLGIGLTLVRRLVELHLGQVSVHSEGEDLGSRFTVRLPAIAPPAGAAPGEAQVASATRILIIEDNEDARETLAVLLRMLGHEVSTEDDGAAGIERARRERFDVMLVDLGLPTIDGFEVARRVRAEVKPVPFLVALTGYGSVEDRGRALAAGFDEHFAKPLDLERFNKLLASRATAEAT